MMNEPPVMISPKDLLYICDMFKQNYNACKLANSFSEIVEDDEIRDFLEELCAMHKEIASDLVNYIDMEDDYE